MKRYVIESRRCPDYGEPGPGWNQVGDEFEDLDDAEREFADLDELNGYDTYHRLVQVKRKVLKSA